MVHGISLQTREAHAQAWSEGGLFLRGGGGASFEGRAQAPLTRSGPATLIEAGIVLPGEASYALELGAFASAVFPDQELRRRAVVRALGLEAGVRVPLGDLFGALSQAPVENLTPEILGGLFVSRGHERVIEPLPRPGAPAPERSQRVAPASDRYTLGPRLGLGLRTRWDTGLEAALLVLGRVEIVPARIEVALVLDITVFP